MQDWKGGVTTNFSGKLLPFAFLQQNLRFDRNMRYRRTFHDSNAGNFWVRPIASDDGRRSLSETSFCYQ